MTDGNDKVSRDGGQKEIVEEEKNKRMERSKEKD